MNNKNGYYLKRNFLSIIVVCIFFMAGQKVCAEGNGDFEIQGDTLISYTGSEEVVVVPEGIARIGEKAFGSNKNITNVILPGSLKSIRDYAFYGCENLVSVAIAKNGEEQTSEPECRAKVFEDKNAASETSLAQYIVEDPVKEIPEDVACIGNFAFCNCSSLVSIEFPVEIKEIGYCAFSGCVSLTKADIPNCVTDIQEGAFSRCESLESMEFPESLHEIKGFTFDGCIRLKTIKFSGKLVKIYSAAFQGCSGLEEVILPEGLEYIGGNAFFGCRNLYYIKIPSSLQNIGYHTFKKTKWLDEKIKENPVVIVNDILIDGSTCAGKVVLPQISKIGYGAFEGSGVTEVEIPEGVNNIGSLAFAGCEKLGNIHLPESIKEIGNNVFEGCKSLTRIEFPKELKTVENAVLKNCENLTYVKFPDKLKRISYGAFRGCEKLRQVIIPARVGTIERAAFEDCKKLKDVIFLGNVERMGWYYNMTGDVFRNCSKNLTIWAKRGSKMQSYAKHKKIAFREIPEKIKITFFKNGGRELSKKNMVVSFYKKYGKLPTVSRKGYQFDGWYTRKKGGDKITSASRVEEIRAHTLYAHWTKIRVKETELTGIKTISGKIKVKWKKVSGADGYELVWADNKKFRDAEKNQVGKTGYVIKKTKTGKKCYVKVRAYTLDSTGKKVYDRYSKVQRMTIPG